MAAAFRTALLIVWVVVSSALMAAVLAPYVLSSDAIQSLVPVCEAKLRGSSCVLCGMTTAYIRLAALDVRGAAEANRYSLALWAGSILNFAATKAYILFRLVQRAGRRG